MDIDFCLLVVFYLVIILYLHSKLVSQETINTPKPILIKPKVKVSSKKSSELSKSIDLIIDPTEIENISNSFGQNLLKYLDVEENDNNKMYRKLTDSVDIDFDNSTGLDKYFEDKTEQYKYNEETNKQQGGLFLPELETNPIMLNDIKNLNSEKAFDDVYAFDDFNNKYATV